MDWITNSILLAKEIFQLVNTKESRKYLDRAVELELQLNRELDTFPQNDRKIVKVKKELSIIARAAIQESQNARMKS